jgi:2-polyprenyl-6-methoxyphenol hydroxylase-like FAD-dependent oxidoreductase
MPQKPGDHAVVLGASIAGLLAARVLADVYRMVTVIDRDVMPQTGANRRGVPQGHHHHALHPRGRAVLDELFPGFTADAVQAGASSGDVLRHCRWLLAGHRLRQASIGVPGLIASRPFLEGQIRARVRALPGMRFLECTDVTGLSTTAGGRITGVQVCDQTGEYGQLSADLVVDATGRGSRTPVWLAEWGYQLPPEERIHLGLGYATRLYRLRPGALGSDGLVLITATPDNPRMGVLGMLEGGLHMLSLGGILEYHPPTDPAGFEAFAASLPFPDISEAIVGAQPLDYPVAFHFPIAVRRHYESLERFPDGLLLLGDAVCSFNPIHGQGMTVAANQALVLRNLLAQKARPDPGRYFRAIAKTVNQPWELAAGADLALPGVSGISTRKIRMTNAHLFRVLAAADSDVALSAAVIRVVGLLDRTEGLFRPDRVLRTWRVTRQKTVQKAGTTPGNDTANYTRDVVTRREVSSWP